MNQRDPTRAALEAEDNARAAQASARRAEAAAKSSGRWAVIALVSALLAWVLILGNWFAGR